jgi:hypothetical protein
MADVRLIGVSNLESEIDNRQIGSLKSQSAISNQQSAISNQQSQYQ